MLRHLALQKDPSTCASAEIFLSGGGEGGRRRGQGVHGGDGGLIKLFLGIPCNAASNK